MRATRIENRKRRYWRAMLAAVLAACVFVALVPGPASAQATGEKSWSDDFATARKIARTDGTKVSGNALKLSESLPTDMGEAVPGESGVYSLVAVGSDVYCGTGDKGHLVQYDADKLFQEGYQGPSHYGVSSSKGQVSSGPVKVAALATDGSKVFGGTSVGHVFSFDPSREGNRPVDKGACPGVTGGIVSAVYSGTQVFFGTADGYVFTYDPAGDTFAILGQPAALAAGSMAVTGGAVFAGFANGHIFKYAGGIFTDIGAPDGTETVNALTVSGAVLCAGLNDGKVYSYDTGAAGPFVDRGGLSGGTAVKSLAVQSGVVYAGADNGHLYRALDDWVDQGWSPNEGGAPVNALAVSAASNVLYGGTGSSTPGMTGRLFRRAAGVYEDFGRPGGAGDMTSIAFWGKTLYEARGEHLYKFTSPSEYEDLEAPSPGSTINDIDTRSGQVYAGLSNGSLWMYGTVPEDPEPSWHDMGAPSGSPVIRSVVAGSFGDIYLGLDDGRLIDGATMGELRTISPASIKDTCYKVDGTGAPAGLYIAASDGNLWRYTRGTPGSMVNLGLQNGDATSANAVAVFGPRVFIGHQGGLVHSYDGSSFAGLGNTGAAVSSMAPGSQGVMCGTADGKLFAQDDGGSMYDEGAVPHASAVLAICHTGSSDWIGTDGGYLISHDDANLGDLGVQVNKQIMIWCVTYDPGRNLYYAGTYTNAHFLVIDPADGYSVTDLGRPIPGEREIEDIMVTRVGEVVGATYGGTESAHNPDGGHLFTYDRDGREFTDRGRAPAPDDNWWISSLAEGPPSGNLIYAATSNSAVEETTGQGQLFSVDKTTWTKTPLGVPVAGEGTRTLIRKDNVIFGATWQPATDWQSHVYKYDVGGSTTVLGEAPPVGEQTANKHINRLSVVGSEVYGAQNDGGVFKFPATVAPGTWNDDIVVMGKPVSQSTSVYPLAGGQDSTLLCGTTGGTDFAPQPGHLVSYDPALGTYRDINVSTIMGPFQQDRVSAISDASVTLCGTRGQFILPGAVDRYAARLFRVDRYTASGTARSTVIDPSLESLAIDSGAVPTGATINALCRAPDPEKLVYGVASNGTDPAKLFRFDELTGTVSGSWTCPAGVTSATAVVVGPDRLVYIGGLTAGGAVLLQCDPADLLTPPAQVGSPIAAGGIYSFAGGPGGKLYLGTGDEASDHMGHLRSYATGTHGDTTDLGQCGTSYTQVNALATSGNFVYGITSSLPGYTTTAEYFDYVPDRVPPGPVTRGQFDSEFTVVGLVTGLDGKLYCGTGPAGRLFSAIPGGNLSFTQDAGFGPLGKSITAIAGTSGGVFGCAGDEADFFEFQGGQFVDAGPLTTTSGVVSAATTDALGKPYFGTVSGSDPVLERYNTTLAYTWKTAGADKSPDDLTTTALVNIENLGGTTSVAVTGSTASPTVIPTLASDKALRFGALLTTTDSSLSPMVTKWEATWQVNASVDQFVYPHTQGVYENEDLRIWGSGFGATPGTVLIGGQTAFVGVWQPNYIEVTVPGGTTGNSILITPDGLPGGQYTGSIALLHSPHIDTVSPASGKVGDYVNVHGSGFLSARGAGDSVTFNGTEATAYSSWSDAMIRVQVPQGASTGDVIASVNSHASNHAWFDVMGGGGPKVSITAPEDGSALKGAVTVTATVQRQGGTSPVELWVDGVKKASDSSAPYAFDWNADAVSDGAHTLTVKAVDGFSRQGSDAHTVYVDHTVPSPSKQWYFAEGCTNYGFETWLLIGNPGNRSAVAHVTFMDDKGETYIQTCDLRPNSRTTVNAADVAPGANVSIQVDADTPVVCERAMYWGNRIEGHDTIGAASLSRTWYFAEGSTDWGFQTFVLLGNPGDSTVKATLHYLFTDGTSTARDHVLAPHSRFTVNAASEVGAKDFSVKVDAGAPGIVAERSIYHGDPRRCGTNTVGVKAPSVSWYLSEGSTDWGFETWLLIQRPASGDAHVTATFRKGNGESVKRTYTVKGNSRFTVNLADEVGIADVSTQVTSDVPVVCERSMYWNARTAGHCTIGSPGPGRTWLLAEGCTDYGFETWVLLDNPNASAVNATVTFLKEDGTTVPVALVLKPQTRLSIDASIYVGADSFSTRVDAASPVMVERAMYWSRRSGGTGSIGAR